MEGYRRDVTDLGESHGVLPGRSDLVCVVGAGRSGRAAVRLLLQKGIPVRLLEQNPDALSQEEHAEFVGRGVDLRFGEHTARDFTGASFVVPSPGIPRARIVPFLDAQALKDGRVEILAEMELAFRYLQGEPILAVTGTSGKTTTVSLAAAMLQEQGYAVFLGGNIGTPLSEYLLDGRRADVLVLEISSFQLQCCATFSPRVAVLMNIAPNHLDYHRDMQEYIDAKMRLFRWQEETDLAVLGKGLEKIVSGYRLAARKVWVDATDRFPDMLLIGRHNRFNAEAAYQAVRFFGVSERNAARAVARFHPLPNRLERVREHRGILYVNDSKCTTIAALKVALEACDRPVRLLCGGRFKGGDLTVLNGLLKEKVRSVALFGASREIFEAAWKDLLPVTWHATLEEAVHAVSETAERHDVVLLAPATASFDLYRNYAERGRDFRRIVEALP